MTFLQEEHPVVLHNKTQTAITGNFLLFKCNFNHESSESFKLNIKDLNDKKY